MTSDEQHTADTTDMAWSLNELARVNPGIINAVLFSSEGLLLASSEGLDRADADRTAAALAGMKSLQADLGAFCGVSDDQVDLRLRHVVSDLKERTVLLFAAGDRTGVGVAVRGDSMSGEVTVAITVTLKMIVGLRAVLEARERSGTV